MAIQLIVGGTGTGKTKYIIEKMIKASMENNHPPIIFVLPEQSNMGAEKDIINMHQRGGTMDISIVSFTRLAFNVFDRDNIYTADVLDDYGKSILVMKVLRECSDELVYYKNMIDRQGFVDEIKSIISEFYQYSFSVERIQEVLKSIDTENSLYYKLSDIKLIMEKFEAAMGDSYMVAEQMLSLLAENVENSKLLKNAEVYFDGFTGFTPVQYEVINRMMRCCGNLYFTVTMDEEIMGDNSYDFQDKCEIGLFEIGKNTVAKISRMAADNGETILPHINCNENYRLKDKKMLAHIERNIFRFPVNVMRDFNDIFADEVSVVECSDVEEEVLFVGRMIKKMVREESKKYRDIAVITGDLSDNVDLWKRIMEQLNIPVFLDVSEPLSHNMIVDLVSLFFGLFENDFSYDSVFSFLKTGFIGIDLRSVYELENYALKFGVHGYSWWNKPFKGNIKGFAGVEKTRKEFMDCVNQFYEVMSAKENEAILYIKAFYYFISKYDLGKKLYDLSLSFEEAGDLRQARVYAKAYEKMISVLDKTADIAGNEMVSRKTISEMLMIGLSDMKLGILPSTLDQVVIGDLERTRLHNTKVLFVVGANEGLLPRNASGSCIINDNDRRRLEDLGVELSADNIKTYSILQFYLYMQMTQASERLVISYRKNDDKGVGINKSFFVKYIMQMFPNMNTINANIKMQELLPDTVSDVYYELSDHMSNNELDNDKYVSPLYKTIENVVPERINDMNRGYLYMNVPGNLNEVIAHKLYGDHMYHSVSRLETFSGCQYQFFLKYGLKLKTLEEYKIESNKVGSILHKVMQRFFAYVDDMGIEYDKDAFEKAGLNEDAIKEKVKELTINAAKEEDDTIFESSFRMKNQLNIIIRVAERSVENLLRHLEAGKMKPRYFEKEFSSDDNLNYTHFDLGDDISMDLSGVIDRIDIREDEDSVYVKVIDYKSSDKDIDFVKVVEGRQLQLAVYMGVVLELLKKKYPDKKIVPTGIFYYQMADKLSSGNTDEEIEKNRIKETKMSGLVNNDDKILQYLDDKTGEVVPVNYTKTGISATNPSLVTEKELLTLSTYTRNKISELGNKIIRGQIDIRPVNDKFLNCDFCDYKSICSFEAGSFGNTYASKSKYSKEEAKKCVLGKNVGDKKDSAEKGVNDSDN